ncbi:MAG: aminopeptidase [Bacteroidales bacterium]|nr:aminopeptidase [Bacteroidales bacterium]
MTKDELKKLMMDRKNASLLLDDKEIDKAFKFCEGYKDFMSNAKTEREINIFAIEAAKKKGFKEFHFGDKVKAGDKIYFDNRGKAVILAVIGTEDIEKGTNITAAHIDSPRLDLKENPLYEQEELALFKTHYYGGIKKYQWTTVPLSLHGVIIKANGEKITVNIGEDDGDPVFVVTDLLPHLAQNQMKRPAPEIIKGEELNILIGANCIKGEDLSNRVKANVLDILNKKYGIVESDLLNAELEAVPTYKPKDVGFDRSMVGAYGHDDKVCAYPELMAILDIKKPKKTAIAVLTDKEETGSDGNTGLNSSYLKYFIEDLAATLGANPRQVFSNSKCLSADVNSAFDPTFPDVFEKANSSFINYGVVVTKFTGSRGKSGTSDANAEFVAEIHHLFDKEKVIWQNGELGRVDLGGGGTVALYMANLNIDTIDVGVPVLSMHAPFEIVSKLDTYMAYKAFYVFQK